jgi:hypothetical protein
MSFFDRAKAAATDLAAKADVAMNQAGINTPGTGTGTGGGDKALRDLGVLAYLEATGRPASAEDRARVLTTLHELESSGRLGALTVSPTAYGTPGAPPPPPGAAAGTPPPPPPAPHGTPPPPPPPPPPHGTPPPPPPHGTPPPPATPGYAGDAPPPPAAPPAPDPAPPGSTPPPPPPSWA